MPPQNPHNPQNYSFRSAQRYTVMSAEFRRNSAQIPDAPSGGRPGDSRTQVVRRNHGSHRDLLPEEDTPTLSSIRQIRLYRPNGYTRTGNRPNGGRGARYPPRRPGTAGVGPPDQRVTGRLEGLAPTPDGHAARQPTQTRSPDTRSDPDGPTLTAPTTAPS